MDKKRGPKLVNGQRATLLTWIAADYDLRLILAWAEDAGWPTLDRQDISYYRVKYAEDIERLRQERRDSAINSGLALKEERIARLAKHADELEAIKWVPDDKGRLWNEKAWRETLDDIAREMGHRKQSTTVEHSGEIRHEVNVKELTDDELARIAARGSDGTASA